MKPILLVLLTAGVATPLFGAPGFRAEIGASYFALRRTQPEPAPNLRSVDEAGKFAPFVAAAHGFNDRVSVRLSYHYLPNIRATADFGPPAGLPPSASPVFVTDHYEDDVHVVSLAPEFHWSLSPAVGVSIAPQLNWVASRGGVSHSTTNALILLRAPHERREDGFTAGVAARLQWSVGPRASLTAGYQFLDLEPSFGRRAQVVSAGLQWRF